MATPLTASYRMSFQYVVSSYTHVIRHYVRAVIVGGDYKVVLKDGVTQITPQQCADGMGNALDNLFQTANPASAAWTLEHLSGMAWNPVATGGTATESGVSTAPALASQITLVLRDTSFKKVKAVVMESTVKPPYHFNVLGSNTGALHNFSSLLWAFCLEYDADTGELNPPQKWVVSRGNDYLQDHPFVGVTGDLNDKIRRGRGLT